MTENKLTNLLPEFLLNSKIYSLIIVNLEGKYIYANEAFKNRFAFMNIDFIGQPFEITVHPEDVEKCNITSYQCITNPNQTFKIQVRKPFKLLGDFYWTEWEFSLFKDENKNPIGILCLGYDISQEKRTHNQLTLSKAKLRAFLESTTDSNILISPDYKILGFNKIANEKCQIYFGKPLKELADIWEYVLPKDKEEFYKNSQKALAGEYLKFEKEVFFEHWYQFSFYPAYNSAEKIIGFTLNSTDISVRKLKEIELVKNEQKLQKIIEANPHSLLIVNSDNTIDYVNEEFEKVFGYKSEEVLGKEIDFLIPTRYWEGHKQLQEKYYRKGENKIDQMERYQPVLTKAGNEILTDIRVNTFENNGKKSAIVVLRDVTLLKKQEISLIKQNETLKKIAWQQSHQVRRPLANILGLINLIKTDQTSTQEQKEHYLSCLFEATQELDEIIHEIVAQSNENEYGTN